MTVVTLTRRTAALEFLWFQVITWSSFEFLSDKVHIYWVDWSFTNILCWMFSECILGLNDVLAEVKEVFAFYSIFVFCDIVIIEVGSSFCIVYNHGI